MPSVDLSSIGCETFISDNISFMSTSAVTVFRNVNTTTKKFYNSMIKYIVTAVTGCCTLFLSHSNQSMSTVNLSLFNKA